MEKKSKYIPEKPTDKNDQDQFLIDVVKVLKSKKTNTDLTKNQILIGPSKIHAQDILFKMATRNLTKKSHGVFLTKDEPAKDLKAIQKALIKKISE